MHRWEDNIKFEYWQNSVYVICCPLLPDIWNNIDLLEDFQTLPTCSDNSTIEMKINLLAPEFSGRLTM